MYGSEKVNRVNPFSAGIDFRLSEFDVWRRQISILKGETFMSMIITDNARGPIHMIHDYYMYMLIFK